MMSSSVFSSIELPNTSDTKAILENAASNINLAFFVVVKDGIHGRQTVHAATDIARLVLVKGRSSEAFYLSDELVQLGNYHVLDNVGGGKWESDIRVSHSLFFTKLTEPNTFFPDKDHRQYGNQLQRIVRWLKAKNGPAFHLTKSFIFQLHEDFHFGVYLIWRPDLLLAGKCKIYSFDSMRGHHDTPTHMRILTHFVMNMYKHSDPMANHSKVAQEVSKLECIIVKVTQQKNFYDCGIHAILNFEILIKKVKIALENDNR